MWGVCVGMFKESGCWWCGGNASSFPFLQAEREHTAGNAWFNLPATPITPELHNDLKVLRMRGAIDPQRHYKKADSKELPKFFQVPNMNLDPSSLYILTPHCPPLALSCLGRSCGGWSFRLLFWEDTKEAAPKHHCGGAHG